MTYAIVTSLDKEKLLVTPNSGDALESFVGKKAQYVDSSDRVWPGEVVGIEDPFLIVRFDSFPTGLGQGQMLQILDGKD